MGLLEGRVALVTGAAAGIGRGTSRAFAREGAKVALVDMDEERGRATADEIARDLGGDVAFIKADIADRNSCEQAVSGTVERFGALDILINNANTLSPNVLLENKTDEMLARTLGIGLWGTWWLMRAALPHMKRQGGGRIVNFHSIDADAGVWLHSDYNATKGAILALTRSAASEWARFNILVNAIAPAAAGAGFERRVREEPGFAERAAQSNPLGRVGDPEHDIAPALLFLASEMGRYVTGTVIPVDGGVHLARYNSKPADL